MGLKYETQSYIPLPTWLIRLIGKGEISPLDLAIWAYISAHQWRDSSTGKHGLCMKRAQDMADFFGISLGHTRKRLRHLHRLGLVKIIYRAKVLDTGKIMRTPDVEEVNRRHKKGEVIKKHSFYRAVKRKNMH